MDHSLLKDLESIIIAMAPFLAALAQVIWAWRRRP